MSEISSLIDSLNWNAVEQSILNKTESDVLHALDSSKPTLEDFKALLSPAAIPHLSKIAMLSQQLTLQRFGRVMQMYVPLYLSNECQNICTYCGFSMDNKLKRKTLTDEEILQEAHIIKAMGYEHVLLVTGEANHTVGVSYLLNAVKLLQPFFSQISIEVQPLEENEYKLLVDAGVHAVLVYQETYHREVYKTYHPKGKKSNFDYRLATPDRAGEAGVYKIGLGTLIGLENWRVEAFYTAVHLQYLEKRYWKTKYSISFPRWRPHAGTYAAENCISNKEFVQLISAYRIFDQEVELSLSTRESPNFRDNVFALGFTSMSAGSKTNPGGYANKEESLEQFEISDERSAAEIAEMLKSKGYEPVWKDWSTCYH
ncbi:MAG: 2-iminoacetate synthase ThiH [Cytophagaceae bacterium]|jgi:2-iminoacetate synthase|nr:2-iminoacetate synthase ThiH [Cytophagaceae bacterium]